jgi:hypothetical protein
MHLDENWLSFQPQDFSARPLLRKNIDSRQLEGSESHDVPCAAAAMSKSRVLALARVFITRKIAGCGLMRLEMLNGDWAGSGNAP